MAETMRAYANPPAPPSRAYVTYVIFILFLVSVFNYMDRMALAILMPAIKADLRISDSQLGLLLGFAFFLFYAVCGVPLARWADRGNRRNIISVALVFWSVATALSGTVQNFWHLLAARAGVGVGEAGSIAPSQSMICDYVPLTRRTGVFAFHNFGLFCGMMVGMVLAGWFGEMLGWRWAFVCVGLPGVLLAAVVRLTIREPRRGTFDSPTTPLRAQVGFLQALQQLWSCATYRWLLAFSLLQGFAVYGSHQWWPSFYQRVFHLGLTAAGTYLGIAIGAGSAIGLLLGGALGNYLARRDVRLPLLISAGATGLALPCGVACLFVTSLPVSIALVLFTAAFFTFANGPLIGALYSVTPGHIRATGGALMIGLTSVLGFGLGPLCVGLVSDALAPSFGNESLRYALTAPLVVLPAMVAALVVAAARLPSDLRAIGADRQSPTTNGSARGGPVPAVSKIPQL